MLESACRNRDLSKPWAFISEFLGLPELLIYLGFRVSGFRVLNQVPRNPRTLNPKPP